MPWLSASKMLLATSIVVVVTLPSTMATSYPLRRTYVPERDLEWAIHARDELLWKYNAQVPSDTQKRQSTGSGNLTNYNRDIAYYISAQFGTPPRPYNILLDTGSSDLWLASTGCTMGCATLLNLYAPGQGSSTYNTSGTKPFAITYVGGSIQGTTAADAVSLVGFTVPNQPFGVITTFQGTVIPPNVTGLMGLGYPRLAQIGVPWWIRSAQLTPWAQPLFSFSLSRQDITPGSGASSPGGTFSIGQLDSAEYQGNIEYINIPTGLESWWLIPLTQIGIGGKMFTISNGGYASLAAIDTATSLIGGPAAVVREIYANIPGAQRGTGASAGYWFYPCSASVLITLNFGGRTWPMDPADFALASTLPGTCTGALFEVTFASTTGPQWIVGDAFLKNVYSVFRYEPPSVGFAAKPGVAIAVPPPTGTTVISAAATGTGGSPFGTLFPTMDLPPVATTTAADGTNTRAAGLGGAMSKMGIMDGWMWLCGLVTMGLVLAQ